MKVFISGKISGVEEQAFQIFEAAEINLRAAGYEPINPMKLNHDHDKSWGSYMRVCIIALCQCDAIYMLPNWESSSGAKLEHYIAENLELKKIGKQ